MRMLVCNFTDLVLVCVPLLELSCCCSFTKAETKSKIKVVFITLTREAERSEKKPFLFLENDLEKSTRAASVGS